MPRQPHFDHGLANNWEDHARSDPLWAILTREDQSGRRWDVDEFFAGGGAFVDTLFERLARHDAHPQGGKALDFGCGVGRLAHGLAGYFESVVGVDVSPTMVGVAHELSLNLDRVEFLLNQAADLSVLADASFDFVNSQITLQHIHSDASRHYIAEFLRVVKRGGVVVFNLPSARRPQQQGAPELLPLPPEGYRATLALVDPPSTMAPGTEATVRVAVRNDSDIRWRPYDAGDGPSQGTWWAGDGTLKHAQIGSFDVGNHWFSEDGRILVQDDGRVALPGALDPGGEVEVKIAIKSPPEPGRYECVFDVVHEWLAWFAHQGAQSARCRIEVSGADAAPATPGATLHAAAIRRRLEVRRERGSLMPTWERIVERLPQSDTAPEPFAMFAIPRPEVVELLRANGGEIVAIEEDHAAGWDWVSYTYFVRRI